MWVKVLENVAGIIVQCDAQEVLCQVTYSSSKGSLSARVLIGDLGSLSSLAEFAG